LKTIYKILITVIIILIIAVSCIPLILGPLVKSKISKFSNGGITFEYSDSHTNIFTKTISFDSVTFLFNNVYYDSASAILLKKLSFNTFSMENLSLAELLFNNRLKFHKLIMDTPVLWLGKDNTIYKKEMSSHLTLLKMLAKTSESKSAKFHFHIDEFEIKKGAFTYKDKNKREINIKNLSLLVTDLQESNFTANEDDLDRLFDFKARLELTGVENISDNYYKTNVEKLIIDSRLQKLTIEGINLTPLKMPDTADPVMYRLSNGNLYVEGVNFKDILMHKDFYLKNIEIKNASVTELRVSNKNSVPDSYGNKPDTLKLFTLFSKYNIGSVSLYNFKFTSVTGLDTSRKVKIGNLKVENIKFDSTTFSEVTKNDLIQGLKVSSQSVYVKSSEPEVEVSYDSIEYSGKNSTIHIGNFIFRATCSPADADTIARCNIKIGSAIFNNLTPEALFSNEGKPLSVHIKNWTANIKNPSKIKFAKKSDTSFKLSEKLNFDIVDLKNGDIKIVKADSAVLNINNFNFSTTGMTIFTDRSKYSKILDYKEIKSGFDKLDFMPDKEISLNVSNLRITNTGLDISGINFITDKKDNTKISFNEFGITGFDIRKVVNKKEFTAKSISLRQPEIFHTARSVSKRSKKDSLNFEMLRQKGAVKIKKYLTKVNIGDLSLTKGIIGFEQPENSTSFKSDFSLQLEKIKFDKNDVRLKDELSVGSVRLLFRQANFNSEKYSMKYDSVIIDTRQDKISFINALLLSKNNSNNPYDNKSRIHAVIPEIDITGPDFNAYLYHPMSFKTMTIDNPTINLHINNKKKKRKKSKALTADIPFSFFKDYIRLNNAKISISVASEKDTTDIKVKNISATWFENVPKSKNNVYFTAHEQMHKADVTISGFSLTNSKTKITINKVEHRVNGTKILVKGYEQSSYRRKSKGRELTNNVIVPEILIDHPVLHKRMGRLANIDLITVETPQVDINLYQQEEKTTVAKHLNFKDTTLKPVFNFLSHFTIATTKIGNLHFQYITKDKNKKPLDITRMSVVIKGINIDSSMFSSHKSIIDDMDITFNTREMITKDSMYLIKSNNIIYSYKENRLILDSIYLLPRFGRNEFFKSAVYQTDRISLQGKKVFIDGIDFESILTDRIYHFDKITAEAIKMSDHRDKRYERKPGDYKLMPQDALKNLPVKITVDSLYVKDSYILYGEYVDESKLPGEVYFDNFNLRISNISNVEKVIEDNPRMDIKLSTKLMNDANMNLDITFILNDPKDYFIYSGHLNNFDLTKMNSMTENLFGLTIKSGKGTLDINGIQGNNEVAQGELFFKYKNLKLALYNRNKAKEVTGILSPFVSFVVNDIKLRSNNPKTLGKPKIGEVYFERDTKKSILNYIWKSTMSGLLTTVGISNKQQKEAMKKERKSLRNDEKLNKEFEKSLKDIEIKNH